MNRTAKASRYKLDRLKMLNINFVPDDYIQSSESRRTNLMYLLLFAAVMAVLGGSFITIKVRQREVSTNEKLVNAKMTKAQHAIEQFERLQTERKEMLKKAVAAVELLEPVPRSVLLASLTNNLPMGVSFLRLNLVQKEPKRTSRTVPTSKYSKARAEKAAQAQPKLSREKLLQTYVDIEGIAPSDLQVAAYIDRLSSSSLLDNVALVESKEYDLRFAGNDIGRVGQRAVPFRRFKLTAMLRKGAYLTDEDIRSIKRNTKYEIRDTKL